MRWVPSSEDGPRPLRSLVASRPRHSSSVSRADAPVASRHPSKSKSVGKSSHHRRWDRSAPLSRPSSSDPPRPLTFYSLAPSPLVADGGQRPTPVPADGLHDSPQEEAGFELVVPLPLRSCSTTYQGVRILAAHFHKLGRTAGLHGAGAVMDWRAQRRERHVDSFLGRTAMDRKTFLKNATAIRGSSVGPRRYR